MDIKLNQPMETQIRSLELPYTLSSFEAHNLIIESAHLKKNPLGDPSRRHNYALVPKKSKGALPVVFHLSGYFSTGFQNFHSKTLQSNFIERVDALLQKKKTPPCIHVFVEASTYWGGSQFLNSHGCGAYTDYILKELVPATLDRFLGDKERLCVIGGSSGGYGALHLISQKNSPFQMAFATAPDSFFQASLLTELFHAAPEIAKYKNFQTLKKAIAQGEIQDKKSFFGLVNAVAMAHCYAPAWTFEKDCLQWPLDLYTGEIDSKIWKAWCKHDPIEFLKKRSHHLKDKQIFLDVGKYDNFSLQFGTRQIFQVLKEAGVQSDYTEFSGNHFGLSARRLLFLERLKKVL